MLGRPGAAHFRVRQGAFQTPLEATPIQERYELRRGRSDVDLFPVHLLRGR